MITPEQITQRLNPEIRPFFKISSVPLPIETHSALVDSLIKAITIFTDQCSLRYPINIVIGPNPIEINLQSGKLYYELKPDVIGLALENFILINVNAISQYSPPIQVTAFLEEMVHSIMGVADELTTSHIVAALYDEVVVIDGKYHPSN